MKQTYGLKIALITLVSLMLGLVSCSDDSTSGGDEFSCSNFTLPQQVAPVQVDLTYFQTNQVQPGPDNTVYQQVSQTAQIGGSLLNSGGGSFALATALLAFAQFSGIQPEASNGSCIWEIAPPAGQTGGLDLSVTVIATQTGDGFSWEIIYDGEVDEETTVEDFTIITGTTSNDFNNGEWRFFDFENPGQTALTYSWDVEDEDNFEANLDVNDGGSSDGSVDYRKEAPENFMTLVTSEGAVDISWNTSTDSGYAEQGGMRMCYENFVNAPCP